LVAATPEFLFRDSLLYFMGAAEQTEPSASEKIFSKYPPAYPSRSGTSLPGSDHRHGTLSSPFEVLRHHGQNRQMFVTILYAANGDRAVAKEYFEEANLYGIV